MGDLDRVVCDVDTENDYVERMTAADIEVVVA
jgi:hypothetical protein